MCAQVGLSVVWVAEPPSPVPGWVVALAILAGLLLLALLIFVMYKVSISRRRLNQSLSHNTAAPFISADLLSLLAGHSDQHDLQAGSSRVSSHHASVCLM